MIGAVLKRMRIVAAKVTGDDQVRYSTWRDVIHETFKWYGRRKKDIGKRMHTHRIDDMLAVEVDDRVIYWPSSADPSRLSDMYFEVFQPDNNHYFNIPETCIAPGDVVLDCGACEGYFTLQALEQGADRVYSMEPGGAISRCLSRTFLYEIRNGRVSLHRCLLGDRTEEVMFFEDEADPTICRIYSPKEIVTARENIRALQMTTVDEFCRSQGIGKLDYIKADVEGGEVALLRGAEMTLKKFRPKLAFAAYHNPDDAQRMVSYIDGLGLGYRFRVKGVVDYDKLPRPVMVHCY